MAADRRHREPVREEGRPELILAPDATFEPDRTALGALASGGAVADEQSFDPDLTREFWGDDGGGRRRRGRDTADRRDTRATRTVRSARTTRRAPALLPSDARPSVPSDRASGRIDADQSPRSESTASSDEVIARIDAEQSPRSAERTRAARATRELRLSPRGAEQRERAARAPDPHSRRTGPVPRPWVDGRPPAPPDATHPPVDLGDQRPTRSPAGRRTERSAGATGLGAVDPLLRRLGAIVMLGVLAVPVALAVRPSADDAGAGLRTIASGERADLLRIPAVARAATVAGLPAAVGAEVTPVPGGAVDPTLAVEAPRAASPEDGVSADVVTDDGVSDSGVIGALDLTASDPPAPACGLEYTIVPGDYWLRLADGAEVPLAELLAANGATVESVIHPGDVICLPDGARTPPPPSTTTTTTTITTTTTVVPAAGPASGGEAPANTPSTSPPAITPPPAAPSSTAPPVVTTTSAPATTTTAAPAPSRPPSSSNPSADQVRSLIREIWPDEQHEMAIRVARRESNFRANAFNGHCCHGVFQIHWNAHRSWLRDVGITSVEQLYDARTNIEIAYRIYQRAGGWGPWRQTAY